MRIFGSDWHRGFHFLRRIVPGTRWTKRTPPLELCTGQTRSAINQEAKGGTRCPERVAIRPETSARRGEPIHLDHFAKFSAEMSIL
jgi:hypothetical protein